MGFLTSKKIEIAKNKSTGLLSIDGDPTTLFSDNGDGTFNINHNGTGEIVDRIDSNNYIPRAKQISWVATSNIDHTAAGSDGNFTVLVDATNTISVVQLGSGLAVLSAFATNGDPNLNTHVQIVSFSKEAGSIISFVTIEFWNGNIHTKVRNFADQIGVLNSTNEPQDIEVVGGNLELIYKAGSNFLKDEGFQETDGLSPDQDILANDVNPVPILLATRDNIIQSISTDLDVENYESSIGTLSLIPNNNAANRFILGFAAEQFVASLLGQEVFSGGSAQADAAASGELIDNPAISRFGNRIKLISLVEGETDLTNATLTDLLRFN